MGLLSALFGGSSNKSSSNSYNKAYDQISADYGGATGYTAGAGKAVSGLLGGDASGFNAYKDATGFDWGAEQGSRGVTANAAARGLLNSGPTAKALVRYGNDYQNQFAKDYISQFLGLGQLGLGAGGLIAGAGQVSNSTSNGSSNSGGLGKAIGSVLGSIFGSDSRLKTNVVKVGEQPDGLGIYEWDYLPIEGDIAAFMPHGRQRGAMAQEVAVLRPWALGPEIGGYMTVNYAALEAA